MKNRRVFALLGLAALLAPTASCQCSGTKPEHRAEVLAERTLRLPNGLSVDLVSGPCSDAASLAVLLAVGIDHDPPGRSGMAQLAARILATATAPGRAERTVETGADFTLYSVNVPADRLAPELTDIAAWMSQPPTQADLDRARALMLPELEKLSGTDAAQTAVRYAEESIQPTPGGGRRRGVPKEVEAITLAELQAFWQSAYKPSNARITVAGRFDPAKLAPPLEAAFTPLPAGTPPTAREPVNATVKGTLVMGETPTAVAIAVPAPARTDALYPAFLLQAARLLEKPAQPRTWDVTYDPIRRPDLLLLTGPVTPAEQPEPAAGRMRTEAAAILARPPTPEDIARTKDRFRLYLEPQLLDPAVCARDPRAFAIARTRHAQVAQDVAPLLKSLDTVTKDQLDEAARLFDAKGSAAVIAGGPIR